MDDVQTRRRAGEKRTIEPLEVLAHQAARQEVTGLDRVTRRIDRTLLADPPVAPRSYPVVQTDSVAGLIGLRLERIQRELPAGIIEE